MQGFLSVPRRQQLLVAAAVLAPQAALARVPWQVQLVLSWSFMAHALHVCAKCTELYFINFEPTFLLHLVTKKSLKMLAFDAASKQFRHITS